MLEPEPSDVQPRSAVRFSSRFMNGGFVLKEKEASTLPVRDALTIARMDEQARAIVSVK